MKKEPYEDLKLAHQANDSERFFTLLFEAYANNVLAIANTYKGSMDRAYQAQDVLMNVFEKLKRGGMKRFTEDQVDSIGRYILKSTKNEALDLCRKGQVRKSSAFSDEIIVRIGGSEAEVNKTEHSDFMENLLRQLAPLKREVFELKRDGYSHDEISTMLGITTTNSRYHLKTARDKLQSLLKGSANAGLSTTKSPESESG